MTSDDYLQGEISLENNRAPGAATNGNGPIMPPNKNQNNSLLAHKESAPTLIAGKAYHTVGDHQAVSTSSIIPVKLTAKSKK